MPFAPIGSDEYTQLAVRLIRSNAVNLDAFGTPIEGENLLVDLVLKVVREENNNAKLIWEAQGSNLPDFHGVEIQVGESETGPWYAMVNPAEDGVFKNDVEHSYFVLTTNVVSGSLVHADLPDDATIYYRLRAFNQSGAKGSYSNIASVVLIGGAITEVTPGDIVNPDPTSPMLSAKTANGNNILTWTRQGDLLDYSHSEIQVADASVGPWFKPDIIGGDTTYRGTTPYTSDLVAVWETAADFNFIHPSVPSVTLYYRVRIVNIKDERSGWSNTVAISAAIVLEAPVLVAIGSLDDIILKWEKQNLLLFEKGIRVQVAEAASGPWYAPDDDIINDVFRGTVVGEYLLVTGNEWVHRDIPLVGNINNNPTLRTLYYRIRRVDFSDNVSDWSNTASATAGRITLASLPGLIDVGKLDPNMFDVLGAFSEHALGHWPLDDTVTGMTPDALGELVDLTINSNPLKVTSSTVGEDVGVLSKALTFSGSAGSVARTDTGIGSSGDTWEQISFSFWIRMSSVQVNTNQRPISYFVGSTVIYFHVIPATSLHELRIRVGSTIYSIAMGQARNLHDDQWHHVFLSYNGASKVGKIFVDAIEFANDIIQNAPASIDQGGNLSIGAARVNSVNTNHIAGRIDEVRLFSFEPELQHVRYLYFIPQGPLAPIVDVSRIPNDIFESRHIRAGAIMANNIGANQVISVHILASAILTAHLSAGVVTADKIAALAITADKIATGALTVGTNGNVTINDEGIVSDMIAALAITADKIAVGALFVGDMGNVVINDEGITAPMLAANSVNLGEATVFGTLTADHIESDVINVRSIWTGDVDITTGGTGFPATIIARRTIFDSLDISQFPYIMVLAKISNFNFTHTIARTLSQRVVYSFDTTRALEIWYDVGDDFLRVERSVEHEELGAGDIGTLTVYAAFGVTYPNATYVSPPDPTEVPSVPDNLDSTETPGASTWDVLAEWDESINASGYNIEYQSRAPGAAWPTTASTTMSTGPSVTLYGSLAQNREYRFRVQAFNDENASTYSDWYEDDVGNIVVITLPMNFSDSSTYVSGIGNNTLYRVTFNWSPSTSGLNEEIEIWRSASSDLNDFSYNDDSNFAHPTNPGVWVEFFYNTNYRWRVRVRDGGQTTNWSDWQYGTTPGVFTAAPGTPSGISLSSTTSSVSGTIAASSGATYYQWKRSTSGTWITISGGGRSFIDTGLNDGTSYTYNARAGNSGGTSGTVTRSISTQEDAIPLPTNFSSAHTDAGGTGSSTVYRVTFNWSPSTSGLEEEIAIWRSANSDLNDFSYTDSSNFAHPTDPGVWVEFFYNTNYRWRVRVRDGGQTTEYSAWQYGTTPGQR